ncbi:hypothetical protein CKAN_02300100 [Cinnamomum micranthum f. kanehirae]|uniref:Uncharacterized protein n=1 Tax=Cinnamomum micranthum f. kanehirae TaxID=337451 RepID=A0A443PSN7_9MAGN|nr:hypothetical protein CKAN_02300100 [Cinnamomum micranthum f. kanehirae]
MTNLAAADGYWGVPELRGDASVPGPDTGPIAPAGIAAPPAPAEEAAPVPPGVKADGKVIIRGATTTGWKMLWSGNQVVLVSTAEMKLIIHLVGNYTVEVVGKVIIMEATKTVQPRHLASSFGSNVVYDSNEAMEEWGSSDKESDGAVTSCTEMPNTENTGK